MAFGAFNGFSDCFFVAAQDVFRIDNLGAQTDIGITQFF